RRPTGWRRTGGRAADSAWWTSATGAGARKAGQRALLHAPSGHRPGGARRVRNRSSSARPDGSAIVAKLASQAIAAGEEQAIDLPPGTVSAAAGVGKWRSNRLRYR